MKKLIYISIFVNILLITRLSAQQLPFDNQYLINKFSLSPAYAGITDNVELFLGFRQNWVGIAGAPQKQMLNMNMPVKDKNMGFGVSINNEKMGNFSNFYFMPSFAYHQKLGSDMSINFGLLAEIYRNQYNFSQAISPSIDPVIQQAQALKGTTFNVGAAIMFDYKGLNLGISVPRTLNSKLVYNREIPGNIFTLSREYVAHLSYYKVLNKKWKIEPFVVARSTQQSPLMYEANVMARYDDRLYAAVGYRKGSDFIISTGASLSPGIVLNYSYEFSTQGIMNYSSGTHEISIGFLIRRSKSKTPPPTIFRENDETPAVDTTLAIRLKKLEIQLAECDCEKKEEMLTKLDERLKKLEVAVDVADAESWEKPFILENIKFGNNSSKLFASSFPELNKLADKMKRNPELILKISGYTDNNGSEKYNVKLSQDRADAVKSYLVKEGCEPDRIETIGRGQENPIASNDDPTGRALNRRIEGQFKK